MSTTLPPEEWKAVKLTTETSRRERWAETLRRLPDRYGRIWDMAPEDRCRECGQPLVATEYETWRCAGGRGHEKVPATDVIRLGGHFEERVGMVRR